MSQVEEVTLGEGEALEFFLKRTITDSLEGAP